MNNKKIYYDDTLNKAIKRVKLDIGPDAMILSTKKVVKDGRNLFEVVAISDQGPRKFNDPVDLTKATKSPRKFARTMDPLKSELLGNLRAGYGGAAETGATKTPKAAPKTPRIAASPTANTSAEPATAGNLALDIENKIEKMLDTKFLKKIDAMERSFNLIQDQIQPIVEGSQYSNSHLLPQVFAKFIPQMTSKGVPEKLASRLMDLCYKALADLGQAQDADIKHWLKNALRKKILIHKPEKNKNNKRVIVFGGPTGVGKTTSVAKMAAQAAIRQKLKVAVISMDTQRIGAIEQLRKLCKLIGVHFEVSLTHEGLVDCVQKMGDYDRIFIDSHGQNFLKPSMAKEFRNKFNDFNHEFCLVLAANGDLETNEQVAANFEQVGYHHLMLTKLDETLKIGGIWSLGMKSKVPLSYFSRGQRIPEDIQMASVDFLFDSVIKKSR